MSRHRRTLTPAQRIDRWKARQGRLSARHKLVDMANRRRVRDKAYSMREIQRVVCIIRSRGPQSQATARLLERAGFRSNPTTPRRTS